MSLPARPVRIGTRKAERKPPVQRLRTPVLGPDGQPIPTRQSLKSAATRGKLIEATVRCLVRHGYARTTTPLVVAEAGLSRGAMLHHFETSATLIRATLVELHERRLRAFRRSSEGRQHDQAAMIAAAWKQLQKPAFAAYQELAMAARSDRELAAIMLPLQAEYRERFLAEAHALFPAWSGAAPQRFAEAIALSQVLLEGMATSLMTGALEPEMVPSLLAALEDRLRAMVPEA